MKGIEDKEGWMLPRKDKQRQIMPTSQFEASIFEVLNDCTLNCLSKMVHFQSLWQISNEERIKLLINNKDLKKVT